MQKRLDQPSIKQFQRIVYSFFQKNRRDLPWRRTDNPYHILVSEIMLQQTQVDRTIPKYKEFIRAFSTVQKLAKAPKRKVLSVWQGMGYNRRALNLQKCAQEIVRKHRGKVPMTSDELEALSGIGPYTARAIMAFAYDLPSVLIETNIRAVYLHHFFPNKKKVSDEKLLPLIEQTLDMKHPRRWYSALMDYGSYLKKSVPNPSRRSAHHVKQTKFIGSVRQARGAILKMLLRYNSLTAVQLCAKTGFDEVRIGHALDGMLSERLVEKQKNFYQISH